MSATDTPRVLSSRIVVFSAVGAALYAVLGLVSFAIPGTQLVAVRPAFALVPFIGKRFGPIAGFFTGFVGNCMIDQLQGFGFLAFWNWSVAVGLVGAFSAVLGAKALRHSNEVARIALTAVGALVATAAGLLFVITDMFIQGISFETFLVGNYFPALISNGLAVVILVPVLDAVWEPLSRQAGR
ncbi:ECF transporter S component [Rhizohabitans arisaemae]|uniref:ECF transporter S component n=1 Tax=Rhizohabitans arisaemae TaxID=2720610 RepID=UPI0024B093DF|nr:ECF transporter S component [Rhizohabitans arisaemae]